MVVAISGKLRSGKDTAAKILVELCGQEYCERKSLAGALKVETAELYGVDVAMTYNDYDYKEAVRHILIKHGQDRRAKDQHYWIKKLLNQQTRPVILVPDLRFKNEANYFRGINDWCLLVRIEASEKARAAYGWNPSDADTDISECDLDDYDDWDLVVQNDGTLKNLKSALSPVIRVIDGYIRKPGLVSPQFGGDYGR